jgi:hypothetical protein
MRTTRDFIALPFASKSEQMRTARISDIQEE